MIKIGDIVQVTNWGEEYTTDYNWFENFDWAPGRVYLVGCEGIKPCCRSMTLEEIEQKLGYKIIIIDKKGDN